MEIVQLEIKALFICCIVFSSYTADILSFYVLYHSVTAKDFNILSTINNNVNNKFSSVHLYTNTIRNCKLRKGMSVSM